MLAAAALLATTDAPASARATACTLRHFAAENGRLAYRSCGTGKIVLILPGGPGLDADYMLDFARMVARSGRRAILFEPRGTGASRAALGDGSRLTVAGSIADVEALRQAVRSDRVTVIGHSFGGATAQAYAAAYPRNVARLILLDSVGPTLGRPALPIDGWRERLTPEQLSSYDAARAGGDRIAAMRIKFAASFYDVGQGKRFAKQLVDSAIHLDVAPLSEDYQRHYSIPADAARPRFPVVIVAGDVDWIRGYEPAFGAAWPGARLLTIPRAGHFPWIDASAATSKALE
ncbi:alpha/beta fold hydrolase [Sphingomonas sp. JC676]|uniref:alpha/beta fold hydrolase n=1 Tax=Sphingomonas sp. JC676 TaxID=2768065 RepID=UPI00223B4C9A|nr:alpha/beta hydrolase [Sphingomonas sp. JC676]